MIAILGWACAGTLLLIGLLALYQWVLALAALLPSRKRKVPATPHSRFIVLIPAHNEEVGLAATLKSFDQVQYPRHHTRIVVIADRCDDRTAEVARRCGVEALERTHGRAGKGAAIAWAVEALRKSGAYFDGLVIVDADTVVDRHLLDAFDEGLRAGHDVQQGYNYLSNPWESAFTRIIAVTSVLRNRLFYSGKERLGLTSMLSGTGMCFSRYIIERYHWTALSVGEDWEFSVFLLLNGETIHFNQAARVFALESHGFRQASTQRLRWASGRQGVAAASTRALFKSGVRQGRLELWDAALTMLAPTYSVQATLALLCLLASLYLSSDPGWNLLLPWAALVTGLLVAYFAAGVALTEAPMRALVGILLIPMFLPWRTAIELLGLVGFGRKRWVRTARLTAAALVAVPCAIGGMTSAEAQVVFQDDFEAATVNGDGTISRWDGPADPSVMYLTDRVARSGRRSLELKYIPGTFGASFMYNLFAGRDQLYVRWYQRWSPGFVWEPSSTKMVIFRPMGGYPQFYPEVLWGNGQFAIQAQVVAEANWDSENFYQNQGEPVTFETGRWYCLEVFVKLNTPGKADGALAAWIDGKLALAYTGRAFRGASPLDPAPSTAQIEAIGLSGHYGGITPVPREQYSWIDDPVASSEPIGHVLMSDDFEATSTDPHGSIVGWDGPSKPTRMHLTDAASHSGARSLALEYRPGSRGAGYMYKHFPPQEQIFLRWYQRWSAGFLWDPSSTSLMGIRPYLGYPHFYPFVIGTDGEFAIQAQVLADRNWATENLFQNRGHPVVFEPERWYCIEVAVLLNTPGVADGALAAWIDGEEKLLYTGRQFRGVNVDDPSPSTAGMSSFVITGSYGGQSAVPHQQYSWQDDHVASTQRIGCQPYAPVRP